MEFGRALIKKRRLLEIDASEIDGEALSPREVAICREFLDDFALRRTDRELELEEEQRKHPERFKVSRRQLAAMVKREVGPLLGTQVDSEGGLVLTYEKPYQAWTITTEIDLGRSGYPLTYDHAIRARVSNANGYHEVLRPIISPMSWMGISGGATHWKYLRDETLSSVVKALSSFCAEFLQAVPLLLDGILSSN